MTETDSETTECFVIERQRRDGSWVWDERVRTTEEDARAALKRAEEFEFDDSTYRLVRETTTVTKEVLT